ncbi:MAG: T9SS type A sorting domain-containing protein [Flavobacteriia bacterium]|nr:T9SS type A sorting domain-containing protein [Flavobacteriia bacterium]
MNLTESAPVIEYDSQNNLVMGLDRTFVLGGTGSQFPSNVWLEKYDQNGNLLWTLSSNITNQQFDSQFIDVTVDDQDNIYIAGLYLGPNFTLGGKTINGFSNNGTDFFIAKVSSSGNVVWLKGVDSSLSHDSRRFVNSITATPDGHLLISGQHYRDFYFGGVNFEGDSTVPYINNNYVPVMFYAKLNADGAVLWHHRALNRHSGQWNSGNGFGKLFQSENGFIYGTFAADSSIVFPNDTIITTPQSGLPDSEGIVRLSPNGELLDWKFLSSNWGMVKVLRLDNCGNPVIMGIYNTSLTIDSLSINAQTSFDVFVTKMDANLNPIWLKSHGSDQPQLGQGLAINDRNDVFIAYDFWGNLSYNNQTFSPSAVESVVVKLDSSGNYVWHNHTEGSGASIQARNLAIAPNNKLTLVAYYNGTKSIDNQSVSNGTTSDLMVATFNDTTHPGVPAGCNSGIGQFEHGRSNLLNVYPNPADDQLHIGLPEDVTKAINEVSIYNLHGKLLLNTAMEVGRELTIDISSLSSGTYILCAGDEIRVKFVKF